VGGPNITLSDDGPIAQCVGMAPQPYPRPPFPIGEAEHILAAICLPGKTAYRWVRYAVPVSPVMTWMPVGGAAATGMDVGVQPHCGGVAPSPPFDSARTGSAATWLRQGRGTAGKNKWPEKYTAAGYLTKNLRRGVPAVLARSRGESIKAPGAAHQRLFYQPRPGWAFVAARDARVLSGERALAALFHPRLPWKPPLLRSNHCLESVHA